MRFRESRAYKIGLWVLTALCLGGAGYLGYRTFFAGGSTARQLKSAESALERGTAAYKAQKWDDAATRFDEANLLCDKGMDAWKQQIEAKKIPPEEALALRGKLLWVKAQALRDQAHAKAHAAGQPLNEPRDPQYEETYRSFAAIPEAEARAAARDSLRGAYVSTTADPDLNKQVLKELLRLELLFNPIDWRFVEPALRKAVEYDATDARANYFLARYEFEQPAEGGAAPTPLARRSAERVDRAREHLAAARKGKAPYWRTAGLEAEILAWPVRTAEARKLKADAVTAAAKALDASLFDAPAGAIGVAERGENLANLGPADAQGLVSVLATGAERGAADARGAAGPDRLRRVLRAALAVTTKVVDDKATQAGVGELVPALAELVAGAQPLLAKGDPAAWSETTAALDALLAKAPAAVRDGSRVRLARARLATADAALATDPARASEQLARAVKELDEGLKAAEAAKAGPAVLDEFHASLLERRFVQGAKTEELEPHLVRLRASPLPRVQQIGKFYDGVLAERQGRLEKARKLLDGVRADKANPDLAFQAAVQLANIGTATGDWTAALAALKDVEARYQSPDLPAGARAWADERLGGSEGVSATLVVANLQVALATGRRHQREFPGKPVPADLLAGYESAADALAKKLRAPTGADRTARLALTAYLTAVGRKKDGDAQLDRLAVDYPDSVEVLRARCLSMAAPDSREAGLNPNGVAAADLVIRKFLKDYPTNRAGKLFYAEWLLQTAVGEQRDRADKAIAFLNDTNTFPGNRDADVDRLLAAALFRAGQAGEAQKVLERLPQSPAVEAVLIQAAGVRAGAADKLKAASARYEDQGLLRVYEAALRLADGKPEEAARGFASAIEFTRVSDAARAGLLRSLAALAEKDPAKGLAAATGYAADLPDEPGVYLAAALAARLSDNVGDPGDKWEQTKTMYAAVNRWDATATKNGVPPGDRAAVLAQFRIQAGDVVGARQLIAAARNREPKNLTLLLVSAELALEPPADTAQARELLTAAAAENSADPRLPRLDAAIKMVSGDAAGAAAVYERLVGEQPADPGPRALLVAALGAAGKKDEALAKAKEWAAAQPADPRATGAVIRLTAAAGKKDEATKVADEFVTARAAEARKRATAAEPPLAPAAADKVVDEARANALLAVAAGLNAGGAPAEARVRATEALKAFPDSNALNLLLGEIALATKDWDGAKAVYERMLKDNPRHFVAGNNLAWLLAEVKNQPREALALAAEVRKARGGDRPVGPERLPADFLDTLGLIYVKLNDPALAPEMRATFEAGVRRYPTDPRMHLFLGHARAAGGERSKALESFDEAVRLSNLKNGLPDDQNKAARDQAEAARKKLRN